MTLQSITVKLYIDQLIDPPRVNIDYFVHHHVYMFQVKPECPLCKQRFRSIIHNVQPNQQYDEYMVQQQQTEDIMDGIDIDSDISVDVSNTNRRFRYR